MKKIALSILGAATLLTTACKNDDNTPDVVNEEEVITTLIVTLTNGNDNVIMTSRDLDGDGPNAPTVTTVGTLTAGQTYSGTAQFLNETESPAENITTEVIEEADEHQVFYIPGGGLDATIQYSDMDSQGNPLGVQTNFIANNMSSGTLNVTLRHEPMKPNDGTLSDAGGETDVTVTFDLDIQ